MVTLRGAMSASLGRVAIRALRRNRQTERIVDVDDGRPRRAASEQQRLRLGVLLHRSVKVEVVLREVREGGDAKADRTYPAGGEGDRGDLHGDVRRPAGSHAVENPRELVGLRRRVGSLDGPVAKPVSDRPDDAADGAAFGRVDRRPDQVGGRGLPVRAGDAHDLERERRVPVHARSRVGETVGHVVDLEQRNGEGAWRGTSRREHSSGPARNRVLDEARAIGSRSFARDEEISWLDGARVVLHAMNSHRIIARHDDVARDLACELGDREARLGHEDGSNKRRTPLPLAAAVPGEGVCLTSLPVPSTWGTKPAPLITWIASRMAMPVASGTFTASFAAVLGAGSAAGRGAFSGARAAASVASATSPLRVTPCSLADEALGVTPKYRKLDSATRRKTGPERSPP
jgi:hypothetical protein